MRQQTGGKRLATHAVSHASASKMASAGWLKRYMLLQRTSVNTVIANTYTYLVRATVSIVEHTLSFAQAI
jgi:hypothetical protein